MQSFTDFASETDSFYTAIPYADPYINLPSVIGMPLNLPSTITLSPQTIPSMITIMPPATVPSVIDFGSVLTPMGNYLGVGVPGANNVVFKRKFRWTIELTCNGHKVLDPVFCKTSSRPNLTIEETEINFLNKCFIPGKQQYEEMTVSFSLDPNQLTPNDPLWNLYKNQDEMKLAGNLSGSLRLWDGCGQLMEEWKMSKMHVQSLQMDMGYSCEETTIEMTLRYHEIQYKSATTANWGDKQTIGYNWDEIKGKVLAYCPAAATVSFGP